MQNPLQFEQKDFQEQKTQCTLKLAKYSNPIRPRITKLRDIAILMYKVKNGLSPKYISDLFPAPNNNYNLRNADFKVQRFNTITYGKHSIKHLGPYLWSRIKAEDRNRPSLECFRRHIRKRDLTRLIENNCEGCLLCRS